MIMIDFFWYAHGELKVHGARDTVGKMMIHGTYIYSCAATHCVCNVMKHSKEFVFAPVVERAPK